MINLRVTNTCLSCTDSDALLHRMTFCAEAKVIWRRTAARLVLIHRTNPAYTQSVADIANAFLVTQKKA
jgi:hypothetical protein